MEWGATPFSNQSHCESACFFSIAATCRVSTWTYLHIHLLLLAGQVEGSQHAISSSRPNHFVRFINLHRPVQWSVLLPSQIHEGPVADTNCVARWIATTKTFSFDDSQLVKCDKAPTFIAKIEVSQVSYIQSLGFKKILLFTLLVGGIPTPLKNMSSSMGRMIQDDPIYIMENKKCSKPPSSLRLQPTTLLQKDLTWSAQRSRISTTHRGLKTYAASFGQGVKF